MRRLPLVFALMALVAPVAVALPATAEEHLDPHPHILLQRPELGLIDGASYLISVRKCVDLANNQALPLNSHHDHIHFGDTGVSFGGEASHAVIPASFPTVVHPLLWSNCAEFEAILPFPIPQGD